MTPEQALCERLLAMPAIAAVIVDRIHPLDLSQDPTLPAITYRREGGTDSVTQEGLVGPDEPRYQVDCYATDYLVVIALAQAVHDALHGQEWMTSDGDRIQAFVALPPTDMDAPPPVNPQPGVKVFWRMADYTFVHMKGGNA